MTSKIIRVYKTILYGCEVEVKVYAPVNRGHGTLDFSRKKGNTANARLEKVDTRDLVQILKDLDTYGPEENEEEDG